MNRPQFSSLISINNDSTLLWRRLPEPRSKSNPGGNHQCLACTETCSGENLQSKWTLRGNIRNLACYFCFQVTQQGSLGRVAMGTFGHAGEDAMLQVAEEKLNYLYWQCAKDFTFNHFAKPDYHCCQWQRLNQVLWLHQIITVTILTYEITFENVKLYSWI